MSFGVVILCCNSDYPFAQGCLASVRTFMPGVPICLLVDGTVDTTVEEALEGVSVLRRETVQSQALREKSFGWAVTKMVAFWESPFERFLLLDADTCVWGDIRAELNWAADEDMVIDQPLYRFDGPAIDTYFFSRTGIGQFDPAFDVERHADRYFCPGVMAARRGIFDLDWYLQLLDLSQRGDSAFRRKVRFWVKGFKDVRPLLARSETRSSSCASSADRLRRPGRVGAEGRGKSSKKPIVDTPGFYGDMGLLNYMIFKSIEQGRLKVASRPIQHLAADFSRAETARRFSIVDGMPQVVERRVLHFCGAWCKPYSLNRLAYSEPMTHFRRQHGRAIHPKLSEAELDARIRAEDRASLDRQGLKGKLRRLKLRVLAWLGRLEPR
jgi:hypothetical protein